MVGGLRRHPSVGRRGRIGRLFHPIEDLACQGSTTGGVESHCLVVGIERRLQTPLDEKGPSSESPCALVVAADCYRRFRVLVEFVQEPLTVGVLIELAFYFQGGPAQYQCA